MKKVAGRLRLDLAQYRELEAFAQFGSELDAATQQTLARGERMVATLNQPQYEPWPMEEQVVAIYAGINGHLDDIPVEDVPRFQDELRERLRTEGGVYDVDPRDGRPLRRDDREAERRDPALQGGVPADRAGAGRRLARVVRPGHQAARPLRLQHAQDHARAGARRRRQAPPRAGADRGDAAVRRPHAGADDRHRPREHVAARAAAAPAARGAPGRDPAAHRRPRARRRVQRADPAPRLRARARAARRGRRGALAGLRQEGPLDARASAATRSTPPGRGSPTGPSTPTRRRSPTGSPSSTPTTRSTASSSSTTSSSRRSCSG